MAHQSGQQIEKYSSELIPLVLESFLDQKTVYRYHVATDLLTEVVVRTAYHVDLLSYCPKLLDITLRRIGTKHDSSLRSKLIRFVFFVVSSLKLLD